MYFLATRQSLVKRRFVLLLFLSMGISFLVPPPTPVGKQRSSTQQALARGAFSVLIIKLFQHPATSGLVKVAIDGPCALPPAVRDGQDCSRTAKLPARLLSGGAWSVLRPRIVFLARKP